jgi:hypothetical protein
VAVAVKALPEHGADPPLQPAHPRDVTFTLIGTRMSCVARAGMRFDGDSPNEARALRLASPLLRAPPVPHAGSPPPLSASLAATAAGILAVLAVACGARTPPLPSGDVASPDTKSATEPDASTPDAPSPDAPPESAPRPPGPVRIAFLGDPGSLDTSSLLAFLDAYGASAARAQLDTTTPLTASFLAGYDVVVLDHLPRSYAAGEAATLEAWVQSGGGLLSLSGFVNDPSDWEQPNSLLAPLSVGYQSTLLLDTPDSTISDFVPHPVTRGLQSLPFYGGYGVFANAPGAVNVAFTGSTAVGVVAEYGRGRVYLWGDEWVEFSQKWTPGGDAGQFWADAFNWLSHRT